MKKKEKRKRKEISLPCSTLYLSGKLWVSILMMFVVQLLNCGSLCDPIDCSTPGFPVFHYPLEFAQTHDHWFSYVIKLSHLLLPPSPPVLNLSWHQGLFQWVSLCIRWPKRWSFSFSISPSNEYLEWISFGLNGLMLLAVGFWYLLSNEGVPFYF